MLSFEWFIRHRIGTSLLALAVLLLGVVAYVGLPVAPLPQIDFPTIAVSASLPGADAKTMASSVATPLERSLSNIPGITQMSSSSTLGRTQIVLQFDLSQNIIGAAQQVQTQIDAAAGLLPKNLPNPPSYNEVNPADFTSLSIALSSDTVSLTRLDQYMEDQIAPQLSTMPGVGLVDFHGQTRPSIRVQLDPARLSGMGLTLEDIRNVIGNQTLDAPKGSLNGAHQAVLLDSTDQLMMPEAYQNLIVAYRDGAPVRIGDVGRVIEAPEDVRQAAWLNGQRAIIADIHKVPGSNVVHTIDAIKQALPALTAALPPSVQVQIIGDRTQTIRASLWDVQITLLLTIALVVMVIGLFLRNLRATLISSLTIPLSLLGTLAVMQALGYSLDNLSLMGLTIAVGFVVDDAIVVIENTVRHLNLGKPPVQAALEAIGEVGFTVVAMTVSLIAVFIPILLMGGIVGRLLREFAVTVSVAIAISGLISLTVTPMLCGWWLKPESEAAPGRISSWLEAGLQALNQAYARSLDRVLRHSRLVLALAVVVCAVTIGLYTAIPKGFFPQVDAGLIQATVQAGSDISYADMSQRTQQVEAIVRADPDVANVYDWVGANPLLSQGRMMINLKPFAERQASAAEIMARLRKAVAPVQGVALQMQVRQDIQVGGRLSAGQYQYTLMDSDQAELDQWAGRLTAWLQQRPQLTDVTTDRLPSASSTRLVINRDTAARLGIVAADVDNVLYDAFGQRQIANLFTDTNQYHVVEEVDPDAQLSVAALHHLYLRSSLDQSLVPLDAVASLQPTVQPVMLNHQGVFPAITLTFNLAPGMALSQAVALIDQASSELHLPATVHGSFQGTTQAFQSSLRSQPWLILAALVVIYIVLGVLYESTIHPLTIISSLPSAGMGALIALWGSGQDLSVIGLIGIILLMGIVKKNAIMLIDFALEAQRQGLSAADAIRQGCALRFRPIMMTTLAALLGAVPLAVSHGAGAELRSPLGVAMVGGLVVSQLLTLYTTPVIYLSFEQLLVQHRRRRQRSVVRSGALPDSR